MSTDLTHEYNHSSKLLDLEEFVFSDPHSVIYKIASGLYDYSFCAGF